MPAKKKKFIDKKNAATFHLVHRSQKDPLQADDEAPQHVLLPIDAEEQDAPASKLDQQRKFGVFYDDDYDYLQHLKTVEQLCEVQPTEVPSVADQLLAKEPSIQLPSQVFASSLEADVGMLNKAAPQSGPRLDWDPDIVAGLDEDFDFDNPDNLLDDDFIVQATDEQSELLKEDEHNVHTGQKDDPNRIPYYRPKVEVVDGGSEDGEDYASDEADLSDDEDTVSGLGSMDRHSFTDLETKTQFTNYSMTSSVIQRSEGLALLDDRFEKLYQQYDDVEIGALDHEDIGGCVQPDSQVLNSVLNEFEEKQKIIALKDVIQKADDVEVGSDAESDDEMVKVVEAPKEKWDCESILSTYSTLYNHPKTIEEPRKVRPIQVSRKTDLPMEGVPQRGLTRKEVEEMSRPSQDTACTYRPKDESVDEKKMRKQAVKTERKARREEKKANQVAFKEEKKKQDRDMLNLQKNLSGIKIN